MGQVMTPVPLADLILDAVGYSGDAVLKGRIMEPSFGQGVFLIRILERILRRAREAGLEDGEAADVIRRNVFGIEKDEEFFRAAKKAVDGLLLENGIAAGILDGNLVLGDALDECGRFSETMDFVVGNPPYVRIHNLDSETKRKVKALRFSDGMTDLYAAFYEIGLGMLRKNGRLAYVSPNSFLRNVSQRKLRGFVAENGLLSKVYDFRSSGAFPEVGTYACVCVLDRNSDREDSFVLYREYSGYDVLSEERIPQEFLRPDGSPWLFGSSEDMRRLSENEKRKMKLRDVVSVRNGVSTNRDSVYIVEPYSDEGLSVRCSDPMPETAFFRDARGEVRRIETGILRKCVKASRCDGTYGFSYMIFPYENEADGVSVRPVAEAELSEKYPLAYAYLESFKDELLSRDMEKGASWFLFARSQGLSGVRKRKVVFRHVLDRKNPSARPSIAEKDCVVYSGLYAAPNDPDGVSCEEIADLLSADDFARYCAAAGKDMANGYVCVTSKTANGYGLPPKFAEEPPVPKTKD